MFGSAVSPREAPRRTKTAVALSDGSLPGAAEALAVGEAGFEHVAEVADASSGTTDRGGRWFRSATTATTAPSC